MKVLVEFDLTNSIHRDLFQKVQTTMQAHDRVNVKLPKAEPAEVTKEELIAAYTAAAKVDKNAAADLLAKLQVQYGEHLSEWSADAKWMSRQQFIKLSDNPDEFFENVNRNS